MTGNTRPVPGPDTNTTRAMAGDGSDGQTLTRRKRVTASKEAKNVSRKEKKASEDSLKEKVTQETSADIQKELTEKLAGLLERDRLGVSTEYSVLCILGHIHNYYFVKLCPMFKFRTRTGHLHVEQR